MVRNRLNARATGAVLFNVYELLFTYGRKSTCRQPKRGTEDGGRVINSPTDNRRALE